jgi:hypothetical protein
MLSWYRGWLATDRPGAAGRFACAPDEDDIVLIGRSILP